MHVGDAFSNCSGNLLFPVRDQLDKNGNFEYGTYHEVLGESLKTRPHLYVGLVVVTELVVLLPNAIHIKCYYF
jgi:hypothetical protein